MLVVLPLIALALVLPPLFRPGRDVAAEHESKLDTLRDRRRALIGAIRELDFDREMGKLSPEDHEASRKNMKAEVAGLIREIEKREGKGRA